MRRSLIVAAIAALLVVGTLAPAGATPPLDVEFVVEEDLLGAPAPFVASGPAVDVGLICDTGIVVEDSGRVTRPSPAGFNWLGIKNFTCDDGSGEFFVHMQARIKPGEGTTFHWVVVGGTGEYERLHGAGNGLGIYGIPCSDPDLCILDIYDGRLH